MTLQSSIARDRLFYLAIIIVGMMITPATVRAEPPLSGRIIDTEGNPVTDAVVTIQGPAYTGAKTDEQGNFSIDNISAAGEYRVRITSQKWVGLDDFRNLPRVTIDPDQPQKLDFTLRRACQAQITVVDKQGQPVAATVYYKSLVGRELNSAGRVTAKANGIVTIGGLDPAATKYIIAASSESHAPVHLIVNAVNPDEIQTHRLVMKEGKTIQGIVMCNDGLPAAGWTIYALPSWWNLGSYPGGAPIGHDGRFELPHITDENFNVSISIPEGDGMSMMKPVLTGANLWAMKQPLRVELDHPSPLSNSFLTGTIRWIGKPVENGVRIVGYCADTKTHKNFHLEKGTTSFKLGPIKPGIYQLSVEHPEIEVMNLRKFKGLSDLENVTLPNQEPLQLVLRVRGKPHVQGTVVDAESGRPVESFRFRATKLQTLSGPNYVQDDQWNSSKNESGSFKLDVLGPGIYTVAVIADDYAIATSVPVNTEDQPDELLSIKLTKGIPLAGKVVDKNGEPIDAATVRALSLSAGAMDRVLDRFVTNEGAVLTDADGRFELRNLRVGTESVRADHPDFAFSELRNIELKPANEELVVTLSPGATIRGTVFDSLGSPEPNIKLNFQDNYAYGGGDREAGHFGHAITDGKGQYEINHLPQTIVYISRDREWEATSVVRNAVYCGDSTTHRLDLGGRSKLGGQLLVDGKPLTSTRLQLGGLDSTFGAMKMFAITNDSGHFTFFGAPAGHWTLYRSLPRTRSEWVKVREVDVAAEQDLDLGTITQRTGTLKIEFETELTELPKGVSLTQYSARYFFGRPAATLKTRDSTDAPFIFENVTPGDYEVVSAAGEFMVRQRAIITDAELDSAITIRLPTGNATVAVNVTDENGEPSKETLTLRSEDERLFAYLFNSKSNSEGIHKISKVPAGRYSLFRDHLRNGEPLRTIDVAPDSETQVELTIEKNRVSAKATARVVVTDEQGVVVPCLFQFSDDPQKMVQQYLNDADSLLHGPSGVHLLVIEHPGFERVEQSIELKPAKSNAQTAEPLRIVLKRTADSQ